jgi:hypothetical protein
MADPQQTDGPSSPCRGTVPLDLVVREQSDRGRSLRADRRAVMRFLLALSTVLGLAPDWGPAPNLQAYADTNLGRDGHGFAGNDVRPGKDGRPWTDRGHGHFDLGPETEIAAFLPEKRRLNERATIDVSSSHVLTAINTADRGWRYAAMAGDNSEKK